MSLRHAILGVLHERSMHGYQVASELERRIAGGRYNSAQIYQGLRSLAELGFVVEMAAEAGLARERRPFGITPSGRHEFERWLRAPLVLPRPPRDDALVKLVFLSFHDQPRIGTFLERLRLQHLRRLAGTRARRVGYTPRSEMERLLTDLTEAALRFREEAELRWIDHCRLLLQPLLDAAAKSPGDASHSEPPSGRLRPQRKT